MWEVPGPAGKRPVTFFEECGEVNMFELRRAEIVRAA